MAKLLYSMGEVTEMFDVNASLIRYWESKFDCIKPHKNKKGNRMFTPSDVENLKLIYHLVKEKGMTLEGANNTMKRRGKSVKRDVSILERLQNIRAMLVEVRNSLGEDSPAEYEAPIEAVNDLITDVEAEAKAEVMETVTTAEEQVEEKTEEPKAEEAPRRRGRPRKVQATSEDKEPAEKSEQNVVRRRTKKKSNENKELFPFYEQSLF
ncbi:MAG: MerR family transcriptional regulator [Alistipes sp.]|nr:MerR family transcriptional regulator [Alistipes sp.]